MYYYIVHRKIKATGVLYILYSRTALYGKYSTVVSNTVEVVKSFSFKQCDNLSNPVELHYRAM